jgi:hypothetical protein
LKLIDRYQQTAARIGFGLAAIGALSVLLWPVDFIEFLKLERIERLFLFVSAAVTWIFVEIKFSEEVIIRNSSENDIRIARIILDHHSEQFRIILKDHHFHSSIDPRYVSELGAFLHEHSNHHLIFQNKHLKEPLEIFVKKLGEFSQKLAQYSVPYNIGGSWRTSIRPLGERISENDLERYSREISEVNALGTEAWQALDSLALTVRKEVPEALDKPLELKWLSPNHFRDLENHGKM